MPQKNSKPTQARMNLQRNRTDAGSTAAPNAIWPIPIVVTPEGAEAALKGIELTGKGVQKIIESRRHDPLEFHVRGSWLRNQEHRIEVRIRNTTANGIYIESIEVERKFQNPTEIDPNRTTRPTLSHHSGAGATLNDPIELKLPRLVEAEQHTDLDLSLPAVDKSKLKSEGATVKVKFADLGKVKSEIASFEVRLRWHGI